MAKIKITQKQYDAIILHEQESRLNTSGDIIIESFDSSNTLLEEGWKEVVLGVAMMLGVGLTGQNKAMAQNAVKNAQTMAQIKATLEDEGKTGELVDMLEKKGMKDPAKKLADNAEKVMDAYNEIAKNDNLKYKVDVKVVNNLQALKGKVGQGYALKNAEISTDTIKGQAEQELITVTDTMDIDLGSDNLFVTGGFTLSQAGTDTIKFAIEEIKKLGGKIQTVQIESSTDAEQIPKFITKEDSTGNIQLAHLRTQSVTNLLQSLGVDSNITHREIPNNGSVSVTTQDFLKAAKDRNATLALREKTSEYRYVKIKITATFDSTITQEKPTPDKVIHHYRFELIKVVEANGKSLKRGGNNKLINFQHKKFSCKKAKKGGKRVNDCMTW